MITYSKIAEQIVGKLFVLNVQQAHEFGERRFACSSGKGGRNVLALIRVVVAVGRRTLRFHWFYWWDVAGAFDTVCKEKQNCWSSMCNQLL